MDKKIILKELKNWFVFIVIATVSLQIVFYKELPATVIMYLISVVYLYTLPGYFILKLLVKDIGFTERIIIGTGIGFGIISVLAYYIGLFGIGFLGQTIILPLVVIILSIVLKKVIKNGI